MVSSQASVKGVVFDSLIFGSILSD